MKQIPPSDGSVSMTSPEHNMNKCGWPKKELICKYLYYIVQKEIINFYYYYLKGKNQFPRRKMRQRGVEELCKRRKRMLERETKREKRNFAFNFCFPFILISESPFDT